MVCNLAKFMALIAHIDCCSLDGVDLGVTDARVFAEALESNSSIESLTYAQFLKIFIVLVCHQV